jgi:ATP-dependent Clp protease protease subunit
MAKIEQKKGSNSEDNRIIYVKGCFDEDMVKRVFESLIKYETSDPTKDILMIIDSYGGFAHSFLAIHDYIKMMRCDVATVCFGKAMSCGQLLLMSGPQGKRFAAPNSRILVHEVSSGTFGKLTDMEIDINESKKIQKTAERLIKSYTKLNKKEIKKLMERDSFLSAKEAKKIGIVDHVVKTHKDLYKRLNL